MRIIGLTGGIATGKTTVSSILQELGATVIDADELAKEAVQPGSLAIEEIRVRFPGMVDADGRVDRTALGELVFRSESERAALNAIVHPKVRAAFEDQVRRLSAKGVNLIIYDVPLLFETKLDGQVDQIIVVTATPDLQVSRLMKRNGLSRQQALNRIASQMPLSEKVSHADWVIDNMGDLASTRRQVERVWKAARARDKGEESR